MKKFYCSLLLLLCSLFTLHAADKLRERLIWQNQLMPQEKMHIMTDRNIYLGGDTIWLRSFLVDGLSLQPSTRSAFVYVELRDVKDSLTCRIKLHETTQDFIFQGHIPLEVDIPSGTYTLIGYTQWMLNGGEELFFKKNVQILNAKNLNSGDYQISNFAITGSDKWHRVDTASMNDADNNEVAVRPTITTDRKTYGHRQRVKVTVDAPAGSVLAASVTDDSSCPIDAKSALHYSILGQPYLHDLKELEAGHLRWPNIPAETSQKIQGKVTTYFREKPLPGLEVEIIAPRQMFFEKTTTDEDGEFFFEGFDFPEDVSFAVRSHKPEKEKTKGTIQFTNVELPQLIHHLEPKIEATKDTTNEIWTETFYQNLQKRMKYNNGEWEMLLNEIEVVAKKKKLLTQNDVLHAHAVRSFDAEWMNKNRLTTLEMILIKLGVRINLEEPYYRGSSCMVVIDDIRVDIPDDRATVPYISDICPVECIESIDLINSTLMPQISARHMDLRGGLGNRGVLYCIRIRTRHDLNEGSTIPDFKLISPLGYQPTRNFHHRQYDESTRVDGSDQRSTLYWNPDLTVDKQGHATFEFWSNDIHNTTYSIRVEGISADGKLLDNVQRITIE